ncbi:PAS domain S-box protein [Thiocystis violacea]|uniref:PAS domain S-box protein n=1 Tax=Thiocystis violacea TaxID=13725 RepID=UPI0019084550|nr:PAS domain S-box protein [Thiocystis violacea]MBK1716202.1 hypothetical protein [Thiocystis violacea]
MFNPYPARIFSEIASDPDTKAAIIADRTLDFEAFVNKHSQTLRAHYAQASQDLDEEDARAIAATLWRYIQYLRQVRLSAAAPDPSHAPHNPRQRAESRTGAMSVSETTGLTPEANERLIHELRVHQIELELQNEELRGVLEELEISRARYFDLYDLAPVGYVTLGEDGLIQEANLAAAKLLETPRMRLVGQALTRFIHPEDQDVFYRCRQELWSSGVPRSCELRLQWEDKAPRRIRLETSLEPMGRQVRPQWRAILIDISASAEMEEALRRGEALLNAAKDIAGLGSFVWDVRDDSLDLSETSFKMTGMDPETFCGGLNETIARHIHPDDRASVRQQLTAMIEQRHTWPIEFRFIRPDGSVLWLRIGSRFEFDEQGLPIRCLGVLYDISEQRRQGEVLRESEARFRLLLEQTPSIAAQGYGPDGTVHYWNKAAETLYGYEAEEAIGRNLLDLIIPPEMREEAKQAIERMAATGQAPPMAELSLRHKDGRRVPVLSSHAVVRIPGGAMELFCLDMGIAERRQAEEALRENQELLSLFMRHSPVYIYLKEVTSTESRVIKASDNFQRMIGLQGLDMVGKTMSELFPAEVAAKITADDWVVVSTGEMLVLEEAFQGRHYSSIKFPIVQDGRTLLAGYTIDITEQKAAEQALREANRHKDEFLAMLGHELRNPIAPIRHVADILSLDPTLDRVPWAASLLSRQVDHISRIVDDLLDVARINRGKMKLRKQGFDLREAVERAMEQIRPRLDKDDQRLEVALPPTPVCVYGDPERLAQVIVNLLSNAAKFSESNTRIFLTLERANEEARIEVRDEGRGMAASLLPSVFSAFSQGEQTLERSSGGLGLGLALVKGLVELHDGQVRAASPGLGAGSTFTVTLPLASTVPVASESASTSDRPVHQSRVILVVDDNWDVAESCAMLLRCLGQQVHTANDGPTALETAERIQPDLILLDIGLPGMDGYEVARRLRATEAGRDARLVALTGYGQEHDRQRTQATGFDAHLLKPLDSRILLAELDRCS